MTAEYRVLNPGGRTAHFYRKEILNDLLAQEGCTGIRVYYGIDDNGEKELVLLGTDEGENDMTNLIVDISTPCPNRCAKIGNLNG
ncbi:MAG: hypothetical protein HRT57_13595 [Crocinitomicaceae bacterium]|nr:hypothetical protein [Crocinitomicaceae bacterium]